MSDWYILVPSYAFTITLSKVVSNRTAKLSFNCLYRWSDFIVIYTVYLWLRYKLKDIISPCIGEELNDYNLAAKHLLTL